MFLHLYIPVSFMNYIVWYKRRTNRTCNVSGDLLTVCNQGRTGRRLVLEGGVAAVVDGLACFQVGRCWGGLRGGQQSCDYGEELEVHVGVLVEDYGMATEGFLECWRVQEYEILEY
jgi:hypothetical protein